MSVSYTEDHPNKMVALIVRGSVTRQDFDEILPKFEAFMEKHDKIRLLEIVESFDGFDPSIMWDGMIFDFKAIPHISHCAVVSDIPWMSPMAKAAGAMTPIKMKTFNLNEVEAAQVWLANAD